MSTSHPVNPEGSESSKQSFLEKVHQAAEQVAQESATQKEERIMRERLAHYQKKSEQLEGQLRAIRATNGEFRELIEGLKDAVIAADRYDRTPYEVGEPSSSAISPVAMVSDWQIGEVINAGETDGFGEFNWEIAKKRVFDYATKLIDWSNMHRRAGFPIHQFHVFSLSDHVSGNIHYELEVTNEFPLPVATANAGILLGEFVSRISAHFDEVVIWEESADNHGRLTRKNQWKQGAKNNMSWLVHTIANAHLRDHENVRVEMAAGTKQLADVQGKKFLLSHGHSVQMWMGIPYYGLERERGREATKRMGTSQEFDYVAIGHFHVPALVSGNIIINGNLPGTTEFDHSQGRFAPPAQASFMVHPKHGLFDFTAWKFRGKQQ